MLVGDVSFEIWPEVTLEKNGYRVAKLSGGPPFYRFRIPDGTSPSRRADLEARRNTPRVR